jgi:four helix bundle protein
MREWGEIGEMRGKDGKVIRDHKDLEIYKMAFDAAMKIFELSKKFPVEERYSLTDQIRRSSRSVCANFAEAWRKRRYQAAFIAKLNDCESESAETQTWIEFAVKCNYMDIEIGRELYGIYNQILTGLVNIINNSSNWLLTKH